MFTGQVVKNRVIKALSSTENSAVLKTLRAQAVYFHVVTRMLMYIFNLWALLKTLHRQEPC